MTERCVSWVQVPFPYVFLGVGFVLVALVFGFFLIWTFLDPKPGVDE